MARDGGRRRAARAVNRLGAPSVVRLFFEGADMMDVTRVRCMFDAAESLFGKLDIRVTTPPA